VTERSKPEDGGHAVGAVRAGDGQVGHPHLRLLALLDQAHPTDSVVIAGKPGAHVIEEPAIDLEDDLQVAGRHHLEIGQRPFLQGLGQQRVVGIGQRPARDVPRLIPSQVCLIEQEPHQFGHGHGGVRVVELDRHFFRQGAPVGVGPAEAPYQVRQRARHQEVLLHEAQALPQARGVVGIEHARDRFSRELLGQGAHELAVAERREIEIARGHGGPVPQRVDRPAAVADHRSIVGHTDQGRGPIANDPQRAAAHLEVAAQRDLHRLVRAGHLPRIGAPQPVVGLLDLPAVPQRLLEDPVLVAQPVAHGGELQRRQRIQEAGGETAQSAVAQAGVGLLLQQSQPVELLAGGDIARDRIEQQVDDVVG
jgi:hypothetical protein